jgi:ATP-dependent helicase HrpA
VSYQLENVLKQDYFRIKARLNGLNKIQNEEKKSQALTSIERDIENSIALREQKTAQRPKVVYPEALPVSQKSEEIKRAIEQNQVVIIAGETGSGKTTQIPKMCLEIGRGIEGKIGHTQPRRLAARSVATRLAQELETELGTAVGFKVRFQDQVQESSYIKLMTDGVLLAEMQQDRFLNQYDTLIIDEAHERSLNIDFILGYLKELLPKRPDLKVIITSATIDPESFSKHFYDAPIIEVTGRTYPVEVRYRPLEETELDSTTLGDKYDNELINGIFAAVEELHREGPGDILLFMNGEREIRDASEALQKRNYSNTEVLPLFARLSASEQNRIFAPHSKRRIVLATNVAETSLTVPGIKYVIDTGTARISRYSYKSKVQRLPIEPISQASANQRKGRCGRTEAGICIRLYSEEDFLSRDEFTAPEILRTNLASVILQMLSLKLGDIEAFPFIQKPDSRYINDGLRLLEELKAIRSSKRRAKTKRSAGKLELTDIGYQLSRIPLDPKLGRMLVAASKSNCLHEVIIIAAALSIQDPKERPIDYQQKSDLSHARFADKDSDFISWLNLWDYLIQQQNSMSRSQFRKQCKAEFLNYLRVREWQDLVFQIEQSVKELGYKAKIKTVLDESELHDDELEDILSIDRDYQGIHQAIVTGLLGQLGVKESKDNKKDKRAFGYQGARNSKFDIFPGSGLFKSQPKWVMAAELTETSKLFARNVAKIDPKWVEPVSEHLVNKSYAEPRWSKKLGSVVANETVSLFGLVLVANRQVQYSRINPQECHEIFIREALVNEQINGRFDFLIHNQKLIEEITRLESKLRRRELLKDEEDLMTFYQDRIPVEVNSTVELKKWLKHQGKKCLFGQISDFSTNENASISKVEYPDFWKQENLTLPLDYDFEPGQQFADGISLKIPVPLLNQVQTYGFDWGIPGLRQELIIALIKGLPKQHRKNFVPAPEYAKAVLQRIRDKGISEQDELVSVLAEQLFRMTGVKTDPDVWREVEVPHHLKINFRVVNEKSAVVAQGFNLVALKEQLQGVVKETLQNVSSDSIEKDNVEQWDFGDLPESYVKKHAGYEVKAFPALTVKNNKVSIELLEDLAVANLKHQEGVTELLVKSLPSPVKYLQQKLPNKAKLVMYFNPFGKVEDLILDCIRATIKHRISDHEMRSESAFEKQKERLRGNLNEWVLETTLQVEKILSVGHQIAKKIKGKVTLEMLQAQGYIKAHLDSLIFKGFVSEVGVEKLPDVLRYINGLAKRLEKLAVDPNRDRINQLEVEKVYAMYDKIVDKIPKGQPIPKEVDDIFWMIEELKVSLFAQQLGTKYPISAKRIKQAIDDIQ